MAKEGSNRETSSGTGRCGGVDRREFLRLAAGLGGLVLGAPLVQGCQRVSLIHPTNTPRPTRTPRPTSAGGTATAAPPTATPKATLGPTPLPTVTLAPTPTPAPGAAIVALVKTTDRAEGVRRAMELLGTNPVAGVDVLVKPNFNSADPAPASTHPEVLRATILKLQEMGAGPITVGDRSGQGDASNVMDRIGGLEMAEELGFDFVNFAGLGREQWVIVRPPGTHWKSISNPKDVGFPLARPVLEAGAVVSVCCLKTHAHGGGITMSLKNSVGMVADYVPGDDRVVSYMTDILHAGQTPRKIVEINQAYEPALIVLDGVDAFKRGGPAHGVKVSPGVVMAATDRVAIDSLGVAILKMFGASLAPVSKVDQIRHALSLGLGVDSPERIHILTGDEGSARFAQELHRYMVDTWA
jgi:uncharacterized protein (DUF362 family)